MKFVIRLKGGSGSGNFGHEGRPGEVGGSAIISTPPLLDDVTQVHTDEVIITRYGKQYTMGYFILPDGHIIDTSTPLKEGDDEESSHIEVVNEHPEWFGIDKASAEDMDSTEVLNKVVHAGSVRVRWYASDKLNKSRLVLETGTVDKAMLRKLQRLYDQRKFPYGHVVDWSAGNAHGEFPLPDFLNAKYVNVEPGTYGTNSIILKEAIIVIKGGSGSGNFGHGGRPGEVGGSASERGGGGVKDTDWMPASGIIRILSVNPPRRSNSSSGNWVVDTETAVPFGNGRIGGYEFFMKKTEAMKFYDDTINYIAKHGHYDKDRAKTSRNYVY